MCYGIVYLHSFLFEKKILMKYLVSCVCWFLLAHEMCTGVLCACFFFYFKNNIWFEIHSLVFQKKKIYFISFYLNNFSRNIWLISFGLTQCVLFFFFFWKIMADLEFILSFFIRKLPLYLSSIFYISVYRYRLYLKCLF